MSDSTVYETRDDVVELIRTRLRVARQMERDARNFPGIIEPGTEGWKARQAELRTLLEKLGAWQREEDPADVR